MNSAIADWHADKACDAYSQHIGCSRRGDHETAEMHLRVFARHIAIADRFRGHK